MNNSDVTPTKTYPVKAKIVVILAAALAVCGWWLLSDREPMQKEMTFAYRKYIVAINRDKNPIELADLRERLHLIELIKQRCEKLGNKKYRCEAIVLIDGRPAEGRHAAGNATYSRDAYGFRFEVVGEDRGRQPSGKKPLSDRKPSETGG